MTGSMDTESFIGSQGMLTKGIIKMTRETVLVKCFFRMARFTKEIGLADCKMEEEQ